MTETVKLEGEITSGIPLAVDMITSEMKLRLDLDE